MMRLWVKRETFELDLLSVLSYDVAKTPFELTQELSALWAKRGEQLGFLFWTWIPTTSLARTYATLSMFEEKVWVITRERPLSPEQRARRGNRGVREWELTRRGVNKRIELELRKELRRNRTHYRPSHA